MMGIFGVFISRKEKMKPETKVFVILPIDK